MVFTGEKEPKLKKCPFCAELIQDEAVKCRWCNEFLDKRSAPAPSAPGGKPAASLFAVIFAMVSIGPFAPFLLPLVWKNPKLSKKVKIAVTVGAVVFALVIIKLLLWAAAAIGRYYKIIFNNIS